MWKVDIIKERQMIIMKKNMHVCLDMFMTGKLLQNEIRRSGYSIRELQEKLNLSCPQPIYRWLNGQIMPSLDHLYILSDILGTRMEDLLMPRDDEMWRLKWKEYDKKCVRKRFKAYQGGMSGRGSA